MAPRYEMVDYMKENPVMGKVKMISHIQGWLIALLALFFLFPW